MDPVAAGEVAAFGRLHYHRAITAGVEEKPRTIAKKEHGGDDCGEVSGRRGDQARSLGAYAPCLSVSPRTSLVTSPVLRRDIS
jgi:hypothetical protein